MRKYKLVLLLLGIFLISLTTGKNIYEDCTIYGNCQLPISPINISTNASVNVNTSNYWKTDIGTLGTVNSTQFKDNSGTLNIIESWITLLGNSFWLSLSGLNSPTADIDWGGFNLNNIGNSTITDTLFINSSKHKIKVGPDGFNGLSTNAFAMQHTEEHPEGTITFILNANKSNSVNDAISILAQVGLNNSAGVLGNSWVIVQNNLTSNLTDYSNCFWVINETGNTARISCDTDNSGSDLFVEDDIQTGGTIFADEGIRAESFVNFIMNGNHLLIQNGSLHIATPVEFQSGVTQGDEVTTFNEVFSGGLGTFTNIQSDLGNWITITGGLCDSGDCAKSNGISNIGNIIMQTNLSTTNINSTYLNFVYSLVKIIGTDSFTVTMNNNVGSGDVTIFTDSTDDVILNSQSLLLPSSMWNQPKITLNFDCDVTKADRECYVDSIKVNGTAVSTTLTNQSGFDSSIYFSDGSSTSGGIPKVGIFYNGSSNTVFPQGNWNFSDTSPGGVSHPALTELEWSVAGHTFTSPNKEMDLGSYDLTTTGKFDAGTTASFTAGDDSNGISAEGVAGDFSFFIGDNDDGRSAFFDDTLTTTEIGTQFEGIKTTTTDYTIIIGDETNSKGLTIGENLNILELLTASSLLYATDGVDTVEMLNGNGIDISTDSSGNNIINSNSGVFVVFADGSTNLFSLNVNGNFASIDNLGNIQGTSLDSDTTITAGGKISGGDVGALFTLGLNDRILDFSTGAFSGFIADDSDGVGFNIENGVSSVNLNTPIATATFVGANVGVGMEDPAYLLEVGDDITASDQFIAVGSGNNNEKGYLFRRNGNTDNSIIQNSEEDLVINYMQTDLSGKVFEILRGSAGTLTAIFNQDGNFEMFGNINATKNITIGNSLFVNNIIGNSLGSGNITYDADVHRFDGVLALNQEYDGLGGFNPDLLLNGGISIVRPSETTFTYLLSAFDVAKNLLGFVRLEPSGQMTINSQNDPVLIQGTVVGIDAVDPDVKFKIRSNVGGVGDSGFTVYHSAGSLTGLEGSAVRHYGGVWNALVGIQGNKADAKALYTDGDVIMANGDIRILTDNSRLQFGATATDLEIYSDGTDGRIDTSANLIFTPGGDIRIIGATNSTAGFIVGADVGITGNYTNGNCWTAYSGGIVYATNCSLA